MLAYCRHIQSWTLCVFWCFMYCLIHAETQPTAVKSQHAKMGPAWPVGLMSNLCSVRVPDWVCVCGFSCPAVWKSLTGKKRLLLPPIIIIILLYIDFYAERSRPFPVLAVPSADLCHEGMSLCCLLSGSFNLPVTSVSELCVFRCLAWLSVTLLTQHPTLPTHLIISRMAYSSYAQV